MKIAYWATACLEPEIEAVSMEIDDLSRRFQNSRTFSVSRHLWLRMSNRGRVMGLNTKLHALARLLIPFLERASDVNHIYGEALPWIYHKSLKRRPMVLTIASEHDDVRPDFVQRCDFVVAQTPTMADRLRAMGFGPDRMKLIFPGIDLKAFAPFQPRPNPHRLSVLFATFPRTREELGPRGASFLLDAARANPAIDFTFVTRPWAGGSSALDAVEDDQVQRPTANIRLLRGVQSRMAEVYRQHAFTVIPYTTPTGGKECPRSLVESFACGVPVLISEAAPLASFVLENDCGRVFPLSTDGFATVAEHAMRDYSRLSSNAVRCAQRYFDREGMFREYDTIYRRLVA